MSVLEYLKNHPIRYKSFLVPFVSFGLISTVAWFLIFLEISPEFFGSLLEEQVALKWIWIFASVSISYLCVKFMLSGPVNDYDSKYVKIIGIKFSNTALVMSSSYVGIMWGALIPVYLYRSQMPSEFEVTDILLACVTALMSVFLLYCFYVVLTANKNAPQWHYQRADGKIAKVLIGAFALAFISGRLLD
ncbi:hypothetical protein, partial [Marinobacter salsuginis]|uniref:hypothetical protein n=1 Tax=Marinobacter salsuginis TaxID=418719 RepID=UPI0012992E6F